MAIGFEGPGCRIQAVNFGGFHLVARSSPLIFFGKRNGSRTCLVQPFELAGVSPSVCVSAWLCLCLCLCRSLPVSLSLTLDVTVWGPTPPLPPGGCFVPLGVEGSGFRVWGSGFRVQGLGSGIWDSRFGVWFSVLVLGFWVLGFGFWVLGFQVLGCGFRVWGLGLEV